MLKMDGITRDYYLGWIVFYPTGFVEWKYSYDCDCRFDYYNQMKGEKNT